MSALLVPILTGGGSAAVTASTVGTFVVKVLKRVAGDVVRSELAPLNDKITALTIKVERETGGNSNGLRQAVDSLGRDVAFIKGTLHLPVESSSAGLPNPNNS